MDENKYKKSEIYLIKSPNSNKGYVGHTIQGLKIRLSKHETDFRGYFGMNPKPRAYRGSFEILIEGEYDIHLLEKFPCDTKEEIEHREAMWIMKLSATLEMTNKNMPSRLGVQDLEKMSELVIPEKLFSIVCEEEFKKNEKLKKVSFDQNLEELYDFDPHHQEDIEHNIINQ